MTETESEAKDLHEIFDIKTVNSLIGVRESYQAPDALMKILWNKVEREKLFGRFLKRSSNLNDDWFRKYFQDVQGDRTQKKQDFTPASISRLMVELTNPGHDYFEPAAGTGGILIKRWINDCKKHSPILYQPSMYFYEVEELGDSALPFLLFNILIRGMNAVVIHGDSLERTINQVYFVQNEKDDFLSFSSLNVLPHSKAVAEAFDVKKWMDKPIEHIESKKYPEHIEKIIKKMKNND